MAAPKAVTRTVPVPGRTWHVTLHVVARDQPPSAADRNTLQHLTAVTAVTLTVTQTVAINYIPAAVPMDICFAALLEPHRESGGAL